MNADTNANPRTVGVSESLIGRPTVAPNTGARLNHKNLRGFTATDSTPTPEWARLPKPGARCQFTQLARTTLIEASERGEFRMITLRQPGATRGIRLMHLPGIFAWLARLDAEQNSASKTESQGGQS